MGVRRGAERGATFRSLGLENYDPQTDLVASFLSRPPGIPFSSMLYDTLNIPFSNHKKQDQRNQLLLQVISMNDKLKDWSVVTRNPLLLSVENDEIVSHLNLLMKRC